MHKVLPTGVWWRFQENVENGEPTSKEDQIEITKALSKWAIANGAKMFAQAFFPLRGGGGMVGGHTALKYDSILDSKGLNQFVKQLPPHALWKGETDGSSFPNGGLRQTHEAAAYTTWDRSSTPIIIGSTLLIPSCFVAWTGNPLDNKTPLLRAQDAINREGRRLLKAINFQGYERVRQVRSYLGWEQEFFVVSAELYRKRPDLVNCGRTLIGTMPTRNQQLDMNYFARIPNSVKAFLEELTDVLISAGCPVACYHNEVAPGQHEISPIFTTTNQSGDYNELMMDLSANIAQKHNLVVLFNEKPFAGINGSGKHNNWSVGTDTGVNFFSPGTSAEQQELFMCATAALMYAMNVHNVAIRNSVAGAGNDHRLGAQEAPPAVISLYPGKEMEKKFHDIIEGGKLHGYSGTGVELDMGTGLCQKSISGAGEDRNRTAPFPFCGNRWEFRAVGSSQNCSVPMYILNTAYADGMANLAQRIEGGMSTRDAVAEMMKENIRVVFTGNGYSKEWLEEAKRRGLPNLKNTFEALSTFANEGTVSMFERMGVLTSKDLHARQEVMFENFSENVKIEAETLTKMVDTGILPACASDLKQYAGMPRLAGNRLVAYNAIAEELDTLKHCLAEAGALVATKALCRYMTYHVRPQMQKLRSAVDRAECLCAATLWPYPSYEAMLYSHHT